MRQQQKGFRDKNNKSGEGEQQREIRPAELGFLCPLSTTMKQKERDTQFDTIRPNLYHSIGVVTARHSGFFCSASRRFLPAQIRSGLIPSFQPIQIQSSQSFHVPFTHLRVLYNILTMAVGF